MRRAGWVLALLLLVACSSKAESLWVLTIKSQHLRVELADYPDARRVGLMFRDSLPENQGMLFVFQKKQPLSFWMRNTKIPLDIAFLADDGTIFQIEPMQPLDEGHHVSREPARFALEVNQGWFSRHQIRVGDRVENLPRPLP
jgi:hypothetical protein